MKTIAVISGIEKEKASFKITISSIPQYSFKFPGEANATHNLFYNDDAKNPVSLEAKLRTEIFSITEAELSVFATEVYYKHVTAEITIDSSNVITKISVKEFK